MKAHFEILVLHGARPSTAAQKLIEVGAAHSLAVHEAIVWPRVGVGSLTTEPFDRINAISKVAAGAYVLVGGSFSPEQLPEACQDILDTGRNALIVVDALDDPQTHQQVLTEITEKAQIQKVRLGELPALLNSEHLKVYAFEKADSTATVAVVINAETRWERAKIRLCVALRSKARLRVMQRLLLRLFDDARVLTMVRLRDPCKDCEGFPGGFLDVHLETLEECGAREVLEECHVPVDSNELRLIDVRSSTCRDQRGHVVDHGLVWFVPRHRIEEVLSSVNAGDDAKPGSAKFVSVSELLLKDMAFDYQVMLRRLLRLER